MNTDNAIGAISEIETLIVTVAHTYRLEGADEIIRMKVPRLAAPQFEVRGRETGHRGRAGCWYLRYPPDAN